MDYGRSAKHNSNTRKAILSNKLVPNAAKPKNFVTAAAGL